MRSGFAAAHAANPVSQAARACAPRSTSRRVCAMTSGSTAKLTAGSNPSSSFVAAISSAPSALPWTDSVPRLFGLGQPMIVLSTMSDGLSVTAFAASMAA